MSSSLQTYAKYSFTGAVGVAAGVLGAIAAKKLAEWWYSRHKGAATEANIKKRLHRSSSSSSNNIREKRALKLYHSFPFRSCRCAWLVNELGVEDQVSFEHVKLHGSDPRDLMAYREVHPHGTLPSLLLEDGSVLLESAAICLYLAECFVGPSGEDFLPESEYTAEYYNSICYAAGTFDMILEPLYMQLTHVPEEKRNNSLVDSMRRKFTISANILSNTLNDHLYVCGDKFTAADCVIGYNVWWASVIQQGSLLEDYPVLKSYLKRLEKRPAFVKTFSGYRKESGGSL